MSKKTRIIFSISIILILIVFLGSIFIPWRRIFRNKNRAFSNLISATEKLKNNQGNYQIYSFNKTEIFSFNKERYDSGDKTKFDDIKQITDLSEIYLIPKKLKILVVDKTFNMTNKKYSDLLEMMKKDYFFKVIFYDLVSFEFTKNSEHEIADIAEREVALYLDYKKSFSEKAIFSSFSNQKESKKPQKYLMIYSEIWKNNIRYFLDL